MDQDELAAIIAKAGDEGRTTLNLSGEGLKCLPSEIGNLTSLKVLHLNYNDLTERPPMSTSPLLIIFTLLKCLPDEKINYYAPVVNYS